MSERVALARWWRVPRYCPLVDQWHYRKATVVGLIIGLLVIWLVLVVVGFAVKALLWLAIVGIVLFIATGVFGAIRGRTGEA